MSRLSVKILSLLFLLAFSCAAETNSSVSAQQLYENGEYKKAGEIFASRLQEGDPESSRYLGHMFAYGQGVKKDCRKAGFFFFYCAKKGDKRCFKEIGDLYKNGVCVRKDAKKAQYYYSLSR